MIPKRMTKQMTNESVENKDLALSGNSIIDEVTNSMGSLSLVNAKDLLHLKESQAFLLSTYTDVPQFRSKIVKIVSVLTDGKFPTADAKFWQCKAEAEVHFNEMVREFKKFEHASIDVDELSYKIEQIQTSLNAHRVHPSEYDPRIAEFDLRRLKLKKEEYLFNMKLLEKTIKYRIEEVTDWYDIAKDLEKKCKYSTTNAAEHIVESHFAKLQFRVDNAKDENEKNSFEDQLNTYKRLLANASAKLKS